ncbi:DUF1127 domain-containing protein [Daeguia caeni]|uniref:DUF1127 domain-containing protein n=1 Tax=Daeguia caeni TaxID=439612 RepID=A0ABV9H916_9HYPH
MTTMSRSMAAQSGELKRGLAPFGQTIRSTVARRWKLAEHLWQVRKLSEFDDHMLRDLGLHRGDIYTALYCNGGEDATSVLSRLARRKRQF